MNFLYNRNLYGMLAVIALTTVACAQNPKVKTITIINGDTTISESNLNEELSKLEKDINITISDDGKESKTIVKKIIINDGKEGEGKAMAYAYSIGDEKDADIEISTDEKGGATKVIVRKKGEGKGEGEENKKVIMKSSMSINDDKMEKMNLNLNVKGTTASVKIETGSKDPINISVLDENGKQVFYESQKDGSSYSKDIKLEKKGTYFMNIIQNKKSTTEKIIVE